MRAFNFDVDFTGTGDKTVVFIKALVLPVFCLVGISHLSQNWHVETRLAIVVSTNYKLGYGQKLNLKKLCETIFIRRSSRVFFSAWMNGYPGSEVPLQRKSSKESKKKGIHVHLHPWNLCTRQIFQPHARWTSRSASHGDTKAWTA